MKKTILIFVLAMLVLTGCSGSKTEQTPTEAPTQAATEPLGALITRTSLLQSLLMALIKQCTAIV